MDNRLRHYGVKGMKWGVRKKYEPTGRKSGGRQEALSNVRKSAEKAAYSIGAKLNPREFSYMIRKVTNNPNADNKALADFTKTVTKETGVLPTNKKLLQAVETMGIQTHSKTKYDNLTDTDLARFKTYTDSARYSRSVNGYLAIGEPKDYAKNAAELKQSLQKNKINDVTVYRSCNLKFSIDGIGKKLNTLNEEELSKVFDDMKKNFSGKSRGEKRVWSTSTSPLFAIDTWRAVNPTAASTYNTYMIIKCKNCPGILADGKTTKGKSLVNTRSNQEGILAPNKIVYRDLKFDKERGMFAITIDATD